jgi:hypothetical protein
MNIFVPKSERIGSPRQGGKYSGPLIPENFLCWQKEKREGRKRGKERKEGKEKKKEKKENRKKEKVTEPISSHFVQGQTLGVGGAPQIIYKRTLIAECSLICRQPCSAPFGPLLALYRTAALVPKFAIRIVTLPP